MHSETRVRRKRRMCAVDASRSGHAKSTVRALARGRHGGLGACALRMRTGGWMRGCFRVTGARVVLTRLGAKQTTARAEPSRAQKLKLKQAAEHSPLLLLLQYTFNADHLLLTCQTPAWTSSPSVPLSPSFVRSHCTNRSPVVPRANCKHNRHTRLVLQNKRAQASTQPLLARWARASRRPTRRPRRPSLRLKILAALASRGCFSALGA